MLQGFTSGRLSRWLGLLTVALTSLGHASSVYDTQPARQLGPVSWLEPLVLGGAPQDGVLAVKDDRDYFRIVVPGPTPVAIYTSGEVDTKGTLYDPDGHEVLVDDNGGEGLNFRINTVLLRSGTYYLRVESSSGLLGGLEDLIRSLDSGVTTVESSSGLLDRLEDLIRSLDRSMTTVESFSDLLGGLETGGYTIRAVRLQSPQPLSLGGSPQEGAISTNDETDFFRMAVTRPTVVSVYTSGGFDTIGTLLDPDGRAIERDNDGGEGPNFRIDTFLPSAGTYYLIVQGFYSGSGSYNLHAERLAEPKRLSLGGPSQQGAIETDSDAHYYRIGAEGPTLATIYTSGDFDALGTLFGPDGRVIAVDDDGGEELNFRISTYLPSRGTYYLRVEGALFSSTATGSYTLHSEQTIESPQPLSLGGSPYDGTIYTDDETDFFRMSVTGPTVVSIYTSGGLDSIGTLLHSDGRVIAVDDDGGEGPNFRIETFLPSAGTYYLIVQGTGSLSGTGSYNLHAERLEPPQLLSLSGPQRQGTISTGGEADYFRMAVREPIALVIHTSGSVDTAGELYDPDGGLIAWDDDGGEGMNFRIDTILLRRGTYLLRILPSHLAFTGSYTLHAVGTVGGLVTSVGRGGE